MGYAARVNPVAQAAKRGEIAPKHRLEGQHFKRRDDEALWAKFFDRVGVRFGKTGNATLFRELKP